MAIWPFNSYFIPKQTLQSKYGKLLSELNVEEALTIQWWIELNLDSHQLMPLLLQAGSLQEWTTKTAGLRSFEKYTKE